MALVVFYEKPGLTAVNVRGKLGGAFGSFGWSGEAAGMIEDRLSGLKLRVPMKGVCARPIGTGNQRIIDMAALA